MKLWELLPLALLGARLCWMSSAQKVNTSAAAMTGNTTSAWSTATPAVTSKDARGTISTTNCTDTSGGTNSTSSGSSGTTTQKQKGNSAGGGSSFSSIGLLLCSIMVQLTWSC